MSSRSTRSLGFINLQYRDADDAYFKIVEAHGSALFGSTSRTAFPKTYRAMFGFCVKLNSLKSAMFDSIESNNPYSFNVLFRCFCEHYLKFMFIWARFVSEKSDAIGSDYYSFCGAVEAQDYLSAIKVAAGLVGNESVADAKEELSRMYPEAADLTRAELESRSNQFKYRAILRALARERYGFVGKEHPFLAKMVPSYALLSSFVHGGPYTDIEMAGYANHSALEECHERAEVAFMMAASAFMLTTIAVSREHPEFAFIGAEVKKVIAQCGVKANSET